MPRIRLTKEQQARRARWRSVHLPRIRGCSRPNASYYTRADVRAVLQHLADAVLQVLMVRPLEPRRWIAAYMRQACKVALVVPQDPQTALQLEMHKKRRVIQNTILDTKADELESKRLIRDILRVEASLELPPEDCRLLGDDLQFLDTEIPPCQTQWSVDVAEIAMAPPEATSRCDVAEAWAQHHRLPCVNLDAYMERVMQLTVEAVVSLESEMPAAPGEWIVLHFRGPRESNPQQDALSLFLKTNYELMRRLDQLKQSQREMHLRLERLQAHDEQVHAEFNTRARFIEKLRVARVTARTQLIMPGTPFTMNGERLWVRPGELLEPAVLTPHEQQALQRAERFLMQEDERRWRFLLESQRRYDAGVCIQTTWRRFHARRMFVLLCAQRQAAAALIQRNYLYYLYHRAIRLPSWCVLGREVVVAASVAQRCAVTFQFYAGKDFPTGNYRRLPGLSVDALLELCREDDECAAFATDGSLKRFVPRSLSQLQPMAKPPSAQGEGVRSEPQGIFIKVYPSKTDRVVNTGIITAVPIDRFGVVTVVLDGSGVTVQVPTRKLSDRWRRVRIRRKRPALDTKRRARKATMVVGGNKTLVVDTRPESAGAKDVELLDDEDDEEEAGEDDAVRERSRHRRVRMQSNEREAVDPTIERRWEDRATKALLEFEPRHTFSDPDERDAVIDQRKRDYAALKAAEYEQKKLASAIRLQCAWRSKRARETFRQVLLLRAKEKERDALVHTIHQEKQQQRQRGKAQNNKSSGGFFSRWLRK
ncbi:hypothetical protein ATCC90586_008703 [Pythium insidiosum]|nr:hypothetical protein ATCC90586_008703 [Pythium insidiosum]